MILGGVIKLITNAFRRKAYQQLDTLYPEVVNKNEYYKKIQLFKAFYQGDVENKDFNSYFKISKFSVNNGYSDKILKTINAAKIICAENTKFSLSEKVDIIFDNEDDGQLKEWFDNVLSQNSFISKLIKYTERSFFALGGMACYPDIDEITKDIQFKFVDQDLFIPLSWQDEYIHECAVGEIITKNKTRYMLATKFLNENNTITITTDLFDLEKGTKAGTKDIQTIIGDMTAITIDTKLTGINKIPIIYTKPAVANNIDYDTPMGLSIFANSIDTLVSLFQVMDLFYDEFANGYKTIGIPSEMLKKFIDPKTGKEFVAFDGNSTKYMAFKSDSDKMPQDYTTQLRTTDILTAIQGFLNILATETGATPGTYSFDATSGVTATEVISRNQKTARTKKLNEKNLEQFITDLLVTTIKLVSYYQAQGFNFGMPTISDKLKIKVIFDDSIITDDKGDREEARTEVMSNVISKLTYLEKYRGYTKEEAEKELQQIEIERDMAMRDLFGTDSNNLDNEDNEMTQ